MVISNTILASGKIYYQKQNTQNVRNQMHYSGHNWTSLGITYFILSVAGNIFLQFEQRLLDIIVYYL